MAISARGRLAFTAITVSLVGIATGLLLGGALTPSTTTTSIAAPGSVEVFIKNSAFHPETITVPVGATVTWINLDATLHTVISDADLFGSGWLNLDVSFNFRGTLTSGSFSYTFTQPGVLSYYCHAHPEMRGKIIVEWF
jgi:plastocyanin